MWRWVAGLTDRWTPKVEDPEQRARFRFGVQAWLIAWPMGVVWSVMSAMQGLWVQSALNGVMVVAGVVSRVMQGVGTYVKV